MVNKKQVLLVLTGLFALSACNEKDSAPEDIRPVFYTEIGKTDIAQTRSFSVVAQPLNQAKLSFKVGGTIDEIIVELGDTIEKGSVIARMNADDYRIHVNKALSSIKNTEVQLATTRSSFLRMESLYAGNNASLNDYERAKAQYESAEAMFQSAKEQVNAAQNQLDYTVLNAPFSGVISAVLADENEIAGAGKPIVSLSSIDNLEVRTAVPENTIGLLRRGQSVNVRFSNIPGKTFPGKITELSPGTPGVAAYPVIIRLSEVSKHLFPGMTGTVEIPLTGLSTTGGIVVTADAVSHDQDGDFVFVAAKTGQKDIYEVMRKNVTLGDLTPEGYEISEGLSPGDLVITAGIRFLYEGREVRLLNGHDS